MYLSNPTVGISAPVLDSSDLGVLRGSYATVTVRTRNSVYTVVIRDRFVVAVRNDGVVIKGCAQAVVGGQLVVFADDGRTLLKTTPIQSIYVLEN